MPQPTSIRRDVVREAATVQNMAARVVANGGEPNYASEKLARALRASIRGLLCLGVSRGELIELINRELSS